MSVFNGYKDVLVRRMGNAYKVDGLSPAGHAFVNDSFAYSAVVSPEYVGEVVSEIVRAGYTVEVS